MNTIWPLGVNPDMDRHAAANGLAHWSCVSASTNDMWKRQDGLTHIVFEGSTYRSYIEELDQFDRTHPMKTTESDPLVQCYCCGVALRRSAMQNLKGHDACPSCIANAMSSTLLPEDYRPVPRRDHPLNPSAAAEDALWTPCTVARCQFKNDFNDQCHLELDHPGEHDCYPANPEKWVGFIDPAFSGTDKTVVGVAAMIPGPDPKGAAGLLKPQLQLIPPVLNVEVAKALKCGADKYGPWNWRKDRVEVMTYIGAMRRHIDAFLNGEDLDPESGTHHLGAVAASCAIVMDAAQFRNLIDNRPPVSTGTYPLCPTTGMPLAELKNEFKSNYFSKEELIKALNDFREKLRTSAEKAYMPPADFPSVYAGLVEFIQKNRHTWMRTTGLTPNVLYLPPGDFGRLQRHIQEELCKYGSYPDLTGKKGMWFMGCKVTCDRNMVPGEINFELDPQHDLPGTPVCAPAAVEGFQRKENLWFQHSCEGNTFGWSEPLHFLSEDHEPGELGRIHCICSHGEKVAIIITGADSFRPCDPPLDPGGIKCDVPIAFRTTSAPPGTPVSAPTEPSGSDRSECPADVPPVSPDQPEGSSPGS